MSESGEQLAQQNKLYYYKQKLRCKQLFAERSYSRGELPELVSKYEGYMQIYRRKLGGQSPNEYYSSSFLNELRDKRNNMFSDEIIEKMVKAYGLKEYGSEVNWRTIASNGVDLTKTKFSSEPQELQSYKSITDKMLR